MIRELAGLPPQTCLVSEDAEFLPELPSRFAGLYDVVPRARIRKLLEVGTTSRYAAVLSARAGCANSGLLCQQVLRHLERGFSERFHYADRTDAERIVVGDDGVVVHARGHRVIASRAVLCTNGFVDYVVEDAAGSPIRLPEEQRIVGRVGYMTAFVEETRRSPASISYIRNTVIGAKPRTSTSRAGATTDKRTPSR